MEEPLYATWFNERLDKDFTAGMTPPALPVQTLETGPGPMLMSPSSGSNTPKDASAYSSSFFVHQRPQITQQPPALTPGHHHQMNGGSFDDSQMAASGMQNYSLGHRPPMVNAQMSQFSDLSTNSASHSVTSLSASGSSHNGSGNLQIASNTNNNGNHIGNHVNNQMDHSAPSADGLSSIHAGNPLLMSWMNDVDAMENAQGPSSAPNHHQDVDFMSHIDDVLQQTFLDLQSLTPPPSASPSINPDQFDPIEPMPMNIAFNSSGGGRPGMDTDLFFAQQQHRQFHSNQSNQNQHKLLQKHANANINVNAKFTPPTGAATPAHMPADHMTHMDHMNQMDNMDHMDSSNGFSSWSADYQPFGPVSLNMVNDNSSQKKGVTKKPRKASVSKAKAVPKTSPSKAAYSKALSSKASPSKSIAVQSSPVQQLPGPSANNSSIGNATIDVATINTGTIGNNSPGSESMSMEDRKRRKQSESRMPLPELYAKMGLEHNHEEAKFREQRILTLLREQGFQLAHKTWIRDTNEEERKRIINEIYNQTYQEYGYSKDLIEVIVRRGSYYLMQGRLRRIRRNSRRTEQDLQELQELQQPQPHAQPHAQPQEQPQLQQKMLPDLFMDHGLGIQPDMDLPDDFMNEFDDDLE